MEFYENFCLYFKKYAQELLQLLELTVEKSTMVSCSLCAQKLTRKYSLPKHIATVHEGKKPFECCVCNAKFAEKRELSRHIAAVHEETRLKGL